MRTSRRNLRRKRINDLRLQRFAFNCPRQLCPFPHREVRQFPLKMANATPPVVVAQEIGQIGRNFLREVGSVFWFIAHTFEETLERIQHGRVPFRAASMMPVRRGPSSRVKPIATNPGINRSVPKRCN